MSLGERLGRWCRSAALLGRRVLGAVIVGVATILLPKSQPDQHWSEPPAIEIVADYDQSVRSGGDAGGDDTAGDDTASGSADGGDADGDRLQGFAAGRVTDWSRRIRPVGQSGRQPCEWSGW